MLKGGKQHKNVNKIAQLIFYHETILEMFWILKTEQKIKFSKELKLEAVEKL